MLVPAPTPGQRQRRNIVGAEQQQGGIIGCLFGTSCFELSRDIQTGGRLGGQDKTVQRWDWGA